MLKLQLPQQLQHEYSEIKSEFSSIQDNWQKYESQIIPEDKKFAQKIIMFIIKVLDYMFEHYEKLNIKQYQEFLAYYDIEFFYGPNGDDRNYLDFDETFNGESVTQFCWKLKDEKIHLTKNKIKEIKLKYSQVLSQL